MIFDERSLQFLKNVSKKIYTPGSTPGSTPASTPGSAPGSIISLSMFNPKTSDAS